MKKRIISLLLAFVLCLSLLPGAALAAENADSADTGKAIQLGTGGITGYADTNSYDYIYYGTWNNSPIKWRVLNDKTNTGADGLFLLSDALLGTGGCGDVYFDDTRPYSNTWQGSDAQSWCSSFCNTNLTTPEQGAVLPTTKSDEAFTSGKYSRQFAASKNILSDDKVFFLSAEEAENEEYGFTNDSARVVSYGTSAGVWWLRSPYAVDFYYAGAVSKYGYISILYVGGDWAARPAFNLNLNSVLFTSAAVGGKADAAVDENLTAVTDYTGSEWKLTLKDSSRSSFSADVNGQASVAASVGSRVQITYSGAQTGENEYVSAMLCDSNDNVLYYGTIAQNSESGTAGVMIPDGLAVGDYTLKVFSEQCSGDKKTDYASDFASIELTVMPVEQFTLTPGSTYYFDLSGENIPGTVNTGNEFGATSLPDTTLHYVPFTYAGTVNAYKLNEATITNEAYAQANRYDHSLFIADYVVTHSVSWSDLNSHDLIFGKDYASGNIGFSMRVPSQGSDSVNAGKGDSERGTPKSNEWDAILNKDNSYIKNWSGMYSFGQDTADDYTNNPRRDLRTVRGYRNVRYQEWCLPAEGETYNGFRPVLEVLNADELDADALKAVTLDLNGGTLGGSSDDIQIIVKNGSMFAAPASDGLTRPDEGTFFVWLGSDGNLYAPGDSVPADVTTLTIQWTAPTYSVTLETNGGMIVSGENVTAYTYGVGAALPTPFKFGFRFDGWYAEEDFSGEAVTEISAADSGDKTFYAKWARISSGSSDTQNYSVFVKESVNGSVTVDRKTAAAGTTVTITVTPDKGFALETLTVTDKSGNERRLTNNGGGKYSFAMPSSEVTVRATFMDDNTMLNFFVDVKASDYFYDAVLWAAQTGVTAGTDAVHFSPDQPCTRAQIVTFFWRAAGSPVVNYAMNMTDVSEDAYYAEAVRWALSEGITTGTSADTFSPDAPCTRAQAVAFLFRYAAPEAVTLQELVSGFADAASVPGYARPAMNWALAAGILQGDGSKLLPNDTCTRAQIVVLLYRALVK